MAKRRRRGFRGLKGLGNLKRPGLARDIIPALIGGGIALGTALGIRAFVQPTTPAMVKLYELAPLAGLGAGALLGGGAMFAITKSSGPAASTAIAASLVGGGLMASEALNAQRAMAAAAGALPAGETAGLGALVAERMRGVVMEPVRGAYGETVALNGVVNPSAFGRETYKG